MTPPQPPYEDLELHPDPEPGSARWVARQPGYLSKRRGCSVIPFLILAVVALIATPSGVPVHGNTRPAVGPALRGAPRTWDGGFGVALRDQAPPRPAATSVVSETTVASSSALASMPAPSGDIGTALYSASATWCAPTPTQCRRWGGNALLAALPTYQGVPYRIRVWRGSKHVDVTVVSVCGCGIDLSPAAFGELAPLSRGRIAVEVEGEVQP